METDFLTDEVHRLILVHYPNCPQPILPDTHFERDMGGDSLDFIELVLKVEKTFRIDFLDEEASSLETVGQLVALIREKQSRLLS